MVLPQNSLIDVDVVIPDYDVLNDRLINKYNVVLPEKVKNLVFSKEGKLIILSMDLVDKLVDEISNMDLDILPEEIKKHPFTDVNLVKK